MLQFFSPSKLNLFFRVQRKRSDGYHEIASLFQAIDFGDRLTLKKASSDRLTCSDKTLSCDETNLVWKALQLFRAHASFDPVEIHLEKRVPLQAGLGGGSGNAATALWALNVWAGSPASLEQIQSIGAQIGSDVAFFFSLGTAYCTGRGEILEPFLIPTLSGWIAKPPYGLSTPAVYKETRIAALEPVDPRKALVSYLTGEPRFFNDLEPAAFRLEPKLAAFKKTLLDAGFKTVSMTGSGTAFFCLGDGKKPPLIPGVHFIPFRSLNRKQSSWYGA